MPLRCVNVTFYVAAHYYVRDIRTTRARIRHVAFARLCLINIHDIELGHARDFVDWSVLQLGHWKIFCCSTYHRVLRPGPYSYVVPSYNCLLGIHKSLADARGVNHFQAGRESLPNPPVPAPTPGCAALFLIIILITTINHAIQE